MFLCLGVQPADNQWLLKNCKVFRDAAVLANIPTWKVGCENYWSSTLHNL